MKRCPGNENTKFTFGPFQDNLKSSNSVLIVGGCLNEVDGKMKWNRNKSHRLHDQQCYTYRLCKSIEIIQLFCGDLQHFIFDFRIKFPGIENIFSIYSLDNATCTPTHFSLFSTLAKSHTSNVTYLLCGKWRIPVGSADPPLLFDFCDSCCA